MERKFAFVKVVSGDYLLPSNDGGTLWRIRQYEDGPSHGLDWPKDRIVWGLWRWKRSRIDSNTSIGEDDLDDWSQWSMWGSNFNTRAEAVAEALKSNP